MVIQLVMSQIAMKWNSNMRYIFLSTACTLFWLCSFSDGYIIESAFPECSTSLNSVNKLMVVMMTGCVLFDVWIEFLNII
jgi:hypothetical protein